MFLIGIWNPDAIKIVMENLFRFFFLFAAFQNGVPSQVQKSRNRKLVSVSFHLYSFHLQDFALLALQSHICGASAFYIFSPIHLICFHIRREIWIMS